MENTDGPVLEKTLAIIKPDAVRAGATPEIQQLIELAGFEILAQKRMLLTQQRAQEFYAEHIGKPFFPALQSFMTSGAVYAMVLARPGAIQGWRDMMGPTNTNTARTVSPRSLRAIYGTDGTQNAVHGSDSAESATREIRFFFPSLMLEPIPDAAASKDFFAKDLQPTLLKALSVFARDKPAANSKEAIAWLANYLLEHNPNKPRIVPPEDLDLSGIGASIDDDFAPYIDQEKAKLADLDAAATKIQSSVRGHQARHAVAKKREQALAANAELQATTKQAPIPAAAATSAVPEEEIPCAPTRDAAAVAETNLEIETTFAMIKPDAVQAGKTEAMIGEIMEAGFKVIRRKELQLTKSQAEEFYKEHLGKPFYDKLVAFMTSGPVCALALEKEGAVQAWRALMGPTDSQTAILQAPDSLRAKFGTDGTMNAVHGSDSLASAKRELALLLPPREVTLAMIKPDAVAAGHTDEILATIQHAGFTILHRKQYTMSEEQAEDFYQEHVGKPFFSGLKAFMTSGPIVALMLEKEGAIRAWRALMGPTNTQKAQEEAPDSLRARFGTDGTCNATHGSDSELSADREARFHFPEVFADSMVAVPMTGDEYSDEHIAAATTLQAAVREHQNKDRETVADLPAAGEEAAANADAADASVTADEAAVLDGADEDIPSVTAPEMEAESPPVDEMKPMDEHALDDNIGADFPRTTALETEAEAATIDTDQPADDATEAAAEPPADKVNLRDNAEDGTNEQGINKLGNVASDDAEASGEPPAGAHHAEMPAEGAVEDDKGPKSEGTPNNDGAFLDTKEDAVSVSPPQDDTAAPIVAEATG